MVSLYFLFLLFSLAFSSAFGLVPDSPVLVAASSTTTSISIDWSEPDDNGTPIEYYVLEVYNSDGDRIVLEEALTKTDYLLSDRKAGKDFDFRCQAVNADGASSWSDWLTVGTENDVPAAPHKLYGDVTDSNTMTGGWKAPDNHGNSIKEYEVEARECGAWTGEFRSTCGTDTLITQSVGNVEYFEGDEVLGYNTEYWFRVRARNDLGWGDWSDFYKIYTPIAGADPPVLNCGTITQSTVSLSWSTPGANGGEIDMYRITLEDPSAGDVSDPVEVASRSITFEDLEPATTYNFWGSSHNENGWGTKGATTSCTTAFGVPAAPTLFGEFAKETSLGWTWTEPADHGAAIERYAVEFRLCADSEIISESADVTDLAYVAEGLSYNTSYALRVRARNSVGYGPFSEWVCLTTLLAPPLPPKPYFLSVTLGWDEPETNGGVVNLYDLQFRATGPDGLSEEQSLQTSSRQITKTDLKNNFMYQVRLRAENEAGWSEWGEWFTISYDNFDTVQCSGVGAIVESRVAVFSVLAVLLSTLLVGFH
eukprot:Rmarinus@m.23350